jgi:hypothetical protein
VTFSRAADTGDEIIRYRGVAVATAKYNVVEVAVANPWLEPRGNGMWAVTAEVSTGADVGPDSMVRRELGTISGTTGTFPLLSSSVTVR